MCGKQKNNQGIVNTTVSDVVAVIKGGVYREIPAGRALSLDGSQSYDPDNVGYSATRAYLWSCANFTVRRLMLPSAPFTRL